MPAGVAGVAFFTWGGLFVRVLSVAPDLYQLQPPRRKAR